jgi:N6-L-threonylcarbamoyladenine synthase
MSPVNENFTILAIETSCDETAAAVSVGRKIFSNVIWSQIEIHQPWGGVVPDLARRAHKDNIDKVVAEAVKRAEATRKRLKLKRKISFKSIDAVAVTQGPGLAIALEVGIKKAKELCEKYQKPLIGVNHMEGHLLSCLGLNSKGNGPLKRKPKFPIMGLLVSGGRTQLVLATDFGKYKILGETLDDAAGEAFDKVAKMLDLGYPGGPIISELAKKGNSNRFDLPIPMARNKSLNFSFSGLKTACLYKIKDTDKKKIDKKYLQDFAASFERVLVRAITLKLNLALEKYKPNQLFLGGGVINNNPLKREVRKVAKKHSVSVCTAYSSKLFSDNAAMICIAGYFQAERNNFLKKHEALERKPGLSI